MAMGGHQRAGVGQLSTRGLCPLDASSTHPFIFDNHKCPHVFPNVPWGSKWRPVENNDLEVTDVLLEAPGGEGGGRAPAEAASGACSSCSRRLFAGRGRRGCEAGHGELCPGCRLVAQPQDRNGGRVCAEGGLWPEPVQKLPAPPAVHCRRDRSPSCELGSWGLRPGPRRPREPQTVCPKALSHGAEALP